MKMASVLMLAIFGSFFSMGVSFGIGLPQVCYGKYGCFSHLPPFHNILMKLPQSPEDIGTKFYLYTRENRNPNDREELDDSDKSKLASSHYDIKRRTIFMCHGWTETSSGHYDWGLRMKDALLDKGDFNVIMTDWSVGANQDLGVSSGNTADLTFTVGCNHLRSTEFYIKTLTEDCSNPFKAHPCSSYVWFTFGWCNGCGDEGCPLMGYRAEETKQEGDLPEHTSPKDTLCRELIRNCTRFS
ncbi:pancreatic lipase-related protein 2-like [Montipora capricornis]|uniref:pancreatic lipase-related protein 2-like n=1 Tax=Montipora capricornis TaxID=246305 RepID=UPI0035F1481C